MKISELHKGQSVRFKTIEQCLSSGIIVESNVDSGEEYIYSFNKVLWDPGLENEMLDYFGGTYIIRNIHNRTFSIEEDDSYWSWPIEIILDNKKLTKIKII